MSSADPIAAIERSRLLVIVRRHEVEDFIGEALEAGGAQVVEISLLSGDAEAAITRWRERFAFATGAGTVTTADQASRAVAAGARFLISPAHFMEVAEVAAASQVPYIPGALTPTEIHACASAGAGLIKVFPARPLGASYIRDLLGPFPHLRLLPTGGIDDGSVRQFLDAGAAAVAVGSMLVNPDSTRGSVLDTTRCLVGLVAPKSQGGF